MSIISKIPPHQPQRTGQPSLRVAIVNNMPDSALIRTEEEYAALLQAAIGNRPMEFRLYALPSVDRAECGRHHIASHYLPIEVLWQNPPDALVVTGTEPKTAILRDERYWPELSMLIDWADAGGIPSMFSCLSAHAVLQHLDGVSRSALAGKCFGVFDHAVAVEHPLMQGLPATITLPHARWNDVSAQALLAAGYEVLCQSDEGGVGIFTKQRAAGWLFCQSHPEYDGSNPLREYRHDIRRFLSRGRATYPELPRGYFTEGETQLLIAFRQRALAMMDPRAMEAFPLVQGISPGREPWRAAAVQVVRNWLQHALVESASEGRETDAVAAALAT
jgi:homoserine O-succinyltransferase